MYVRVREAFSNGLDFESFQIDYGVTLNISAFQNVCFRLGCPGFTKPECRPTPVEKGVSKSLFFPDEAINRHPRFRCEFWTCLPCFSVHLQCVLWIQNELFGGLLRQAVLWCD